MRKIELKKEPTGFAILADGKQLDVRWSKELSDDLQVRYNIDVQNEIMSALVNCSDLTSEEAQEVLRLAEVA
jgi:hypothetical protein